MRSEGARANARICTIDVVPRMLEHGTPRDIFDPDGLHMTAAGYAIWTRAVRAALLSNTEAEARACALWWHVSPQGSPCLAGRCCQEFKS